MRRYIVLALFLLVVALGAFLFGSVKESRLFRISAPQPTVRQSIQQTIAHASSTVVKQGLSQVSTTTLLVNPRYTGQDELGRNWLLTAESAGQAGSSSSGTYVLNRVSGTFANPSSSQPPLTVVANKGEYTQQSQTILLTGDVSLTGAGLVLTAPTAAANLQTRQVQASGGTQVTGRAGGWHVNITAPQLNGWQNNQHLTLTGGVHAILTPMK